MRVSKFRFHEFELDTASRELRREGQRVALPPKSFECMTYLLAHRDRAVGRDELISAVWGRVDVSDTVVAQTLFRARKALGDSGLESRLIRTVPRFGYQWIAPLRELPSIDAEAPTNVAATSPPCVARPGGRAWHAWGSLVLLFSAAGFAGWILPRDYTSQSNATVEAPLPSSIDPRDAARELRTHGASQKPEMACERKQRAAIPTGIACIARSHATRDTRGAAHSAPAAGSRTSP